MPEPTRIVRGRRLLTAKGAVEITCDSETGAYYIYLESQPRSQVHSTAVFDGHVNLDFDVYGKLIGIEILP